MITVMKTGSQRVKEYRERKRLSTGCTEPAEEMSKKRTLQSMSEYGTTQNAQKSADVAEGSASPLAVQSSTLTNLDRAIEDVVNAWKNNGDVSVHAERITTPPIVTKIKRHCSTCLQPTNHLTRICGTNESKVYLEIFRVVQALADPQEWLDDHMYAICSNCESNLRQVAQFQQQLRTAQKYYAMFSKRNGSNDSVNGYNATAMTDMELSNSTTISIEEPDSIKLEFVAEEYDVPEFATRSDLLRSVSRKQVNSHDGPFSDVSRDHHNFSQSRSSQEAVSSSRALQTTKDKPVDYGENTEQSFPESSSSRKSIHELLPSLFDFAVSKSAVESVRGYSARNSYGKRNTPMKTQHQLFEEYRMRKNILDAAVMQQNHSTN